MKHIRDVAQRLIADARPLHFAAIAKSIEQQQGCQIFLVPYDYKALNVKCRCSVLTSQSYITIGTKAGKSALKEFEKVPINHHFIYYKPSPGDIAAERFIVAHGLAHCALHWPLGPRKDRLFKGNIHVVDVCMDVYLDVYLVKFLPKEEEEADALASLLVAHRPAV